MIKLVNLKKSFGDKAITKGLDLTVETGEFLAIIGRSGEGKSVLLKQIIGLIKSDAGQIIIDGDDISELHGKELQAVFKKCGYVFQFAALLDSLTVFENVGITMLEDGVDPESVHPIVVEKIKRRTTHFTHHKYTHVQMEEMTNLKTYVRVAQIVI